MKKLSTLLIILLVATAAHAGGRGGSTQAFDPNLYGGAANVSCLTAAIAGVCSTGYNATCSGSSDDSAAVASFRAAAIAANPTLAILYFPPGKICDPGSEFISWNNVLGDPGINNLVIWAGDGGGLKTNVFIGGEGFPQSNTPTALIQTVSAGSSTVTVVTLGDISKFSAGQLIAVTGFSVQAEGGYPPNFQWYEYKIITNVNSGTGVITLDSVLANSYKSTWPGYDLGASNRLNNGGPATIYIMPPSWNTNIKVYGLTVKFDNPASEMPMSGRTLYFNGLQIIGGVGMSPTSSESVWFFNSSFGVAEVDKNMTFVGINNSYGAIAVQSPTPQVFIISKFTGYTNGMAKNSIIDNSNFSNLQIAPNCYGHGQSIAISYATITSGNQVGCITLASDLTFANIGGVGTFSVANDAVHRQQVQQTFGVPGGKYYYGVYSQGFPICNTGTTFTVTDTTQTGSFVGGLITGGSTFYATDIGTTQPTPTCPSGPLIGQSANAFGTYPADTITQRYSTGTDMTQFAPP